MARQTFEPWIPEEYDSGVIARIHDVSAIEAIARLETMRTDTRHVPRAGDVDVETIGKGGTYGEDVGLNDEVLLTARKFGKAIRVAQEDLDDVPENIIAIKQLDWATSFGRMYDNSSLGVTGTENGTTVPFTSVYKSLRTTNSATGYTADANYTPSGTGGPSYLNLSQTFAKVETSDWWDDGNMIVLAHPAYKATLRELVDSQGRPIFIQGLAGTPDTLFENPIRYSLGMRTHPTASPKPTGKPLLMVGNRQLLIKGVRSGPESAFAGADTGAGFLSDEALFKMRARRGFCIGHEKGFAMLEDTR